MQPISFTSKIIIDNNFRTFLNFMYNDKNKRCEIDEVVNGKDVYTMGAATCIAGGVANQKDCFVFHYCEPTNDEIADVCDKFESLNTHDKKANALVTGGFANGRLSKLYFNKFMDRFKQTNIEPSVLWGQEDGDTSVHYSVKNDTWTVHHRGGDINSVEDLKKTYQVVKIASGDELWIDDKRVEV